MDGIPAAATHATPPDESRLSRAAELVRSPAALDRLRMVVRKASRATPGLSDEFESQGWVALWKAALGYRPELGIEWEHYAAVVIRNDMVQFRRAWMGSNPASRPRFISLDDKARRASGKGKELTLADVIPWGGPPVGSECEARDAADRALGMMTPIQRLCARTMYIEEAGTQRQAMRRAGVCKDTMRRHLNDGIERVRAKWRYRDE
jgi:hypothetical protein